MPSLRGVYYLAVNIRERLDCIAVELRSYDVVALQEVNVFNGVITVDIHFVC